jgi:PAS domain S-box-containing protein
MHAHKQDADKGLVQVQEAPSRETSGWQEAEAALRVSEDRFRQLVTAVQDYAIFLLDPHGRILSWNAGAQRIKGYTAEEILGRHFSCFYPQDVAERGWPDEELRLATAHGHFEDEGWRLRKDGSRFWASVVITPWRDDTGTLRGFLKISRDLTERKAAEEKLQSLAAQLQRSNSELEQFASIAAHDLQEPLRKILAFGDRLKVKYSDALGEQGRDYLQRMQSAATRMRALINDLLSFSRVLTKAQPFVSVDLTELVQEAVSDLEARFQQTGGGIEVGPLPTVEADPLQLRQVFQNLIGNALKFHKIEIPPVVVVQGRLTPPPEPTTAEGRQSSPFCEITVQDNGIGFEEQYLDRIFEVFQRLHGRQEYEGTGMGLAICRKIVLRHGGTITARSAPGQGSTFILTLPVKHCSG